jgi:DNA-binding CsgD family transcriptional regulator
MRGHLPAASVPRPTEFDGKHAPLPLAVGSDPSPPSSGPLDVLWDHEWRRLVDHLKLSPREAEITRAILRNQKVSAIAAQLALSPHTVHTYRERLYRKLRVTSALELVAVLFSAHVTLSRLPLTTGEDAASGPCPLAR